MVVKFQRSPHLPVTLNVTLRKHQLAISLIAYNQNLIITITLTESTAKFILLFIHLSPLCNDKCNDPFYDRQFPKGLLNQFNYLNDATVSLLPPTMIRT